MSTRSGFPTQSHSQSGHSGQNMSWMAALSNRLHLSYHTFFVAMFLGVLLLPLRGFTGNLAGFDTAFWGYRDLLRGYTGARLFLLQDQIFEKTLVRANNWLVFTGENSLDDYQSTNPFTNTQLAQVQHSLDALDALVHSYGGYFLVIIAPDKNTVYPEYVPPEVPILGNQSRIDQLVAYQQAHGKAQMLDLRPALLEARKTHPVYYTTDTHWNQYGIYAAYRATLITLQPSFSSLKAHTLDDFHYTVLGEGSGDLGIIGTQSYIKELAFELRPRFKRQAVQFTLTQGGQLPGRVTATHITGPAASSLPSALVYHDSFGYGMIPFLAEHFRWAVYPWTFKVDENLIAREKPDIVILEVTELYLGHLLDIGAK